MLKVRIITALVLAPLVVMAIYLLPVWAFAIFVAIAAGLGVYEWSALAGLENAPARIGYLVVFFALAAAGWLLPELRGGALIVASAAWLVAAAIVLFYPRLNVLISAPWVVGIAGFVVALGAWSALVELRMAPNGAHWVMWVLLVCWAADIGAYFAGRAMGRRKLAPKVSPGKTWEGAIGGALLTLLVCGGLIAYAGIFSAGWLALIVFVVAVSVLGDLFESVLKRQSQIKDSGSILPGHGGMLDRIDSVLAVAPVFALLHALLPALTRAG